MSERGTPREVKEYFSWLHEGGGGMLWSSEMWRQKEINNNMLV